MSKDEKQEAAASNHWTTPAKFLASHRGLIGRSKLYEGFRDGTIPCVKLGPNKILIPANALDQIFARQNQRDEDEAD